MKLGIVGLGRMGSNIARRLTRAGHACVAFDAAPSAVTDLAKDGPEPASSLKAMIEKLPCPRAVWRMVPAAAVEPTIRELAPMLEAGDTIIDGGNSHYHDDIRRAKELSPRGIHYVDVGTSGGVWGLERGFCLMIGGEKTTIERLDPIFRALAPPIEQAARTPGREERKSTAEQGYLHCGASGAGHFVKMVHNGIEYGMMAGYAEGLNILKHANIGKGVPAPVLNTALTERFASRGAEDFANKLLSALRYQFGGHQEKHT